MNKFIIATLVVIAVLVLGGGIYYLTLSNNQAENSLVSDSSVPGQTQPTKKAEPKTEAFVSQRVADYWENTRFGDFGPNYELMCSGVKQAVSKEVFVQKYKQEREDEPLRKPEKVEVGDVRIEGDSAIARVTIFTLFYTEGTAGTSELVYEDGKWCLTRKPETLKWLQE